MPLRRSLVEPRKGFSRFAFVKQHLRPYRLRLINAAFCASANERCPLFRRTGKAGTNLLRREGFKILDQNLIPSVAKAERPAAIDA